MKRKPKIAGVNTSGNAVATSLGLPSMPPEDDDLMSQIWKIMQEDEKKKDIKEF